ncbi:hypothetical protein KOI35_26415 [Actinoplanes bogorensis]|uniref:Uncharacterized protein n=1 Tax=Paractinoplanes bogorensis TaxID=1610840 RepID=A0ABS5YUC6_9ACTN|nr:hypothetical protein [Actinoplanes bogorensis]MBU2667052.1 hypothetical protein [Actinoplanes bogorensis]
MDFRGKLAGGRGLLPVVLGCAGWLLLIPAWWLAETPLIVGSLVGWAISWAAVLFAVLVSVAAVLIAGVRRSWGAAVVSVCLLAGAAIVVSQHDSQIYPVDYRYRLHRAALADLVQDYRAGRVDGDVSVPADLRSLCPSGFAYASSTVLFVQLWQNWRAESGTGLAYLAEPPPAEPTPITTASGDFGYAQREVGDGWWWVE